MIATVCSHCKGAGKIKISWWKKKICSECKGSGYVNKLATPVRRHTQSTSSQDDGALTLDFTRSDNPSSSFPVNETESFAGKGGEFGGAGAGAHWGDSHSNSNSNCNNNSLTPSSDDQGSSCSSDSGGSSGGGD